MDTSIRAVMVGCGGMARHHMRRILAQGLAHFTHVSEPSDAAYAAMAQVFEEAGLEAPPNEPDLSTLLGEHAGDLDAAFIITPHALHFAQARACLEAGLDVLLEKPMVMNEQEALELIRVRDGAGKLLVVSFNGSLSPTIRRAVALLRSGDLGEVLTIHASVWQDWKHLTGGAWRQDPLVAGGGFMFDTGAHLLNTVSDLIGEPFSDVSTYLDNRSTPVDILGAVLARSRSGILVTLSGCGETIKSCHSDMRIFCSRGILRTDVWGKFLELQLEGESELSPVEVPPSLGQWQQFLQVRRGELPNPCPPEVGLRMARLWDAVRTSAAQDGAPVRL